jgi:hypothetical protein
MATRSTKRPVKKRKRPRSRAPARQSRATERDAEQGVRVRMYRLGLGECFLISFPRLGRLFHMLIDCGVAPGTPHAIMAVAKDILKTTRGELDVVVVTHRHWNHVSGFLQARDIFRRMRAEQVWLSWTENPSDARAAKLAWRRHPRRVTAPSRVDQALDVARSIGRTVRYWRGGEGPVALSGVGGARVFFLAPPTPDAGTGAALRMKTNKIRSTESPFDQRYRLGPEEALKIPLLASYPAEDWRQIGEQSREPLPPLRLDTDAALNDTSLAIAIELAGPRGESKVLLFPGDASATSWYWWHEHRWPPEDPNAVTCANLLEATVLYKVSHNGSASGTAMQVGLDMMTSPDLVAMISVDEEAAMQRRWIMPAPSLLTALASRTRGRIIRTDRGVPESPGEESDLSPREQLEFEQAIQSSDLYIDYEVKIPQLTAGEREMGESNWAAAYERRVYLIDKKLAGTIRPAEDAELREIEALLDEYMSLTAPTGAGLLTELRQTLERSKRSDR